MWPHTNQCENIRWHGDLGKNGGCALCYTYVFVKQFVSLLKTILRRRSIAATERRKGRARNGKK